MKDMSMACGMLEKAIKDSDMPLFWRAIGHIRRAADQPGAQQPGAQQQVARAVAQRGYRDGWTAEQFAARQVCKLAEELAELGAHFRGNHQYTVEVQLEQLGIDAKLAFDEGNWTNAEVRNPRAALEELADVMVVVFCLAEALGEMLNERVDVVALAMAKANTDMVRGVR